MHGPVTNPIGLALTAGALAATVFAGSCSTSSDEVSIDDARTTLLGYIIDVPGADGYGYAVTDDRGHELDTAKIIDIDDGSQPYTTGGTTTRTASS